MKKTNWHGSQQGKKFEDTICEQLDSVGIEYIREKVAHSKSTAKTTRGKFDLKIGNVYLELKTTSADRLSYSLDANCTKSVKIKGHQVANLYKSYYSHGKKSGLLLEYRPNKPIFIRIEDFMKWVTLSKAKTLNYANAKIIGIEIDNITEVLK